MDPSNVSEPILENNQSIGNEKKNVSKTFILIFRIITLIFSLIISILINLFFSLFIPEENGLAGAVFILIAIPILFFILNLAFQILIDRYFKKEHQLNQKPLINLHRIFVGIPLLIVIWILGWLIISDIYFNVSMTQNIQNEKLQTAKDQQFLAKLKVSDLSQCKVLSQINSSPDIKIPADEFGFECIGNFPEDGNYGGDSLKVNLDKEGKEVPTQLKYNLLIDNKQDSNELYLNYGSHDIKVLISCSSIYGDMNNLSSIRIYYFGIYFTKGDSTAIILRLTQPIVITNELAICR